MQSVILRVSRCVHCKYPFVSEQTMLISLGEYFRTTVLAILLRLEWKFASLSSGSVRFLSTYISQGSVATHLRCGGMFNYCFARNILLNLPVYEF